MLASVVMMSMLCVKFRNRGRSWGPSSGGGGGGDIPNGVDPRPRKSHTIKKMSPPLPITEDTPPDMLAGSMDLRVVLPGGHSVKMSVDRSTPMMDLLVQVTTANKISPGGHVIQALGERGVLPYKPSTPIGALDTWTIHIVPKHQMSQSGNKKGPLKPVNQPFEQTFRLQVHLPRNQLYVARVSPKAVLSDILMQVCSEKNLDSSRYSLRHPNNLDQVLNLSCTLADYKLQEVTLVYNRSLPVEVSTVDIMALQRDTANSAYNNFTLPRNNRSCDGSVSSGSLGGRSLSPVHSDESSASPPPPPPSRPIRKRRPAPKPPTINDKQVNGGDKIQLNESQTVGQTATVICHSRNSSDSSGYHEASVLSESPQSNSLPDSLPRRSKLPSVSTSELTQSACEVSNNLSRSLSNLTTVGNTVQQTTMRQYNHSTSATSLTTIGGRKKKAAPPPPSLATAKMSSVNEEQQQQQRTASVSSITSSSSTTLSGSDSNSTRKSATLPRLSSTSSTTSIPESPTPIQTVPLPPNVKVDTIATTGSAVDTPAQPPVDSIPGSLADSLNGDSSELRMADEEIDRIFHNATRDHTSLESGMGEEPPLSLSSLPSPPASLTQKDLDQSSINPDPMDWEYKLPAPPTFRDEMSSPTVTQFDTVTIGNLTDVFGPPSILETESSLKKTAVTSTKGSVQQRTVKQDAKDNNKTDNTITKDNTENLVVAKHDETEYNIINSVNLKSSKSSVQDSKANKEVAESASKVTTTTETVTEKKAVINELSSVITERLNKPEVDVETQMKKSSTLERATLSRTLDNFTITTYKDNKKPIEVFEDDSIKSSAGEKRDTSKDDAAFRAPKPRVAEPSLTRTCSFSVDDKPIQPTVKRSISYVSLLAANMPRNSQPYKAHLAKSNITLSEKVDEDNYMRHDEMWPRLRKTTSEVNISRDSESNREQRHLSDKVTNWQNGHDSETTGLQSLQVLRSILPQLSQSQGTVNLAGTTSHNTFEKERVASNSNLKFERKLLEDNERDHALKFKCTQTEDVVDHEVTRGKVFERSHSVDQEASEKPVRYVYSGPPTINLSTWNERPKRQVSIKNDKDYVFGVGKRSTEEPTLLTSSQPPSIPEVKEKETTKQREPPANITMRLVSKNNTVKVESARPKSVDLSHVPIVRSVELKKPYAGLNMGATGFLQSGKSFENINRPDDKYKIEINKTSQDETASFTGVNSIAKKFGQSSSSASSSSSKSRPVSCYLFGTETPITKHAEENKEKKNSGTSKVLLNSSTTPITTNISSASGGKKFTSIVGINGPETKVEIKTTNEKLSSKVMINEERKIKNGVLPNKIEYKSSDVRALSKLSSGGFVDPNSPIDSSKAHPLSNQRRDSSSSSTSNTPRIPNDSSPTVVSLKAQSDFPTDSSKALNNSNSNNANSRITSSSSTPSPASADKTNTFFGSNTIERSVNVRPTNFPLPVVKGFRSISLDSGTESSGGIPPPPPIMPVLKSTTTSRRPLKQLPPPEADPRDMLLESIRAFGKDSLRKVAK